MSSSPSDPAHPDSPRIAWVHLLGMTSVVGLMGMAAVSSTVIPSSARLPLYFTAWGLLWMASILAGCWVGRPSLRPEVVLAMVRCILIWGAALRFVAFLAPPVMEDDFYRYLWDGRQLIQTGNPYLHPPSHFFDDARLGSAFETILERVNYPHVPTIYAPVLQYGFGLAYLISPASLWPWKLILIIADLVIAGSLWKSRRFQALAWYSWCPLVLQENGMTAHPDLLGAAFITLAFVARSRSNHLWAGIALGFAVATKITGLIFVPFLLPTPRYWRGWIACLATFAVLYGPFWLQGSLADWTGLSQFAHEWEFNSGGFALLKLFLGPSGARFEALWLTACGLAYLWWIQRHDAEPRLDVVCGWFFLWSAVIQPWYLLWALPWVFLRPTFTGFTALAAVSLSYIIPLHSGQPSTDVFLHPPWVRPVEFGLILCAFLLDLQQQRRKGFSN